MSKSIDPASSPLPPQRVTPFAEIAAARPQADYTSQISSAAASAPPKDPNLSHLQEQIKTAMMRVLVDVFGHVDEAQQAMSPPTRLQMQTELSARDAREKLVRLQEDLQMVEQWNTACLTQVKKALQEIDQLISSSDQDKSSWVTRLFGG